MFPTNILLANTPMGSMSNITGDNVAHIETYTGPVWMILNIIGKYGTQGTAITDPIIHSEALCKTNKINK